MKARNFFSFQMDHSASLLLLLSIGFIIGLARLLGELFKRAGQPALVGEILAGIILGPSIFGRLAPGAFSSIFPTSGPLLAGQQAITLVGVVFFLLTAGMEVNFELVKKQSRSALVVGLFGLLVPFVTGYFSTSIGILAANLQPGIDPLLSQLFLAAAFSI